MTVSSSIQKLRKNLQTKTVTDGYLFQQGDWKLVSLATDTTWHLYNMATDKSETTNFATKYPDKVKQLREAWKNWADTHQVFPKPGKS